MYCLPFTVLRDDHKQAENVPRYRNVVSQLVSSLSPFSTVVESHVSADASSVHAVVQWTGCSRHCQQISSSSSSSCSNRMQQHQHVCEQVVEARHSAACRCALLNIGQTDGRTGTEMDWCWCLRLQPQRRIGTLVMWRFGRLRWSLIYHSLVTANAQHCLDARHLYKVLHCHGSGTVTPLTSKKFVELPRVCQNNETMNPLLFRQCFDSPKRHIVVALTDVATALGLPVCHRRHISHGSATLVPKKIILWHDIAYFWP